MVERLHAGPWLSGRHPDKLIVLGEAARGFGLYAKITGRQRIDPARRAGRAAARDLAAAVDAGVESGHAHGKAVRSVKSCIGCDPVAGQVV